MDKEVFEAISIAQLIYDLRYSAKDAYALLQTYKQEKTLLTGSRAHKKQISSFIFELFSEANELPSRQAELLNQASKVRAQSIANFVKQAKNIAKQQHTHIIKNIIHMHANRLGCDQYAESRALLLLYQTLGDYLSRAKPL